MGELDWSDIHPNLWVNRQMDYPRSFLQDSKQVKRSCSTRPLESSPKFANSLMCHPKQSDWNLNT